VQISHRDPIALRGYGNNCPSRQQIYNATIGNITVGRKIKSVLIARRAMMSIGTHAKDKKKKHFPDRRQQGKRGARDQRQLLEKPSEDEEERGNFEKRRFPVVEQESKCQGKVIPALKKDKKFNGHLQGGGRSQEHNLVRSCRLSRGGPKEWV